MMRLRRLNFTDPTKREALARSNGICECHRVPQLMKILANRPCGVFLVTGHVRYEHIICDDFRPDNALDNCAVLTTTCWRLKTDKSDLPTIAKARRQADRHAGIRGSVTPLPAGRADRIKRTLSGMIIDRATGQKWGVRNG